MRMPSPSSATSEPTSSDSRDGFARMNTSGANTQPSATRNLARNSISETDGSRTGRHGRQAALDRGDDLGDLDVEQAHPIQLTPPQMMTPTDLVARNADVLCVERTVARGPRRA